MLLRGNTILSWDIRPDGDATWNTEDWARACNYEMRWRALGISETERRRLLPCAVQVAKHPGTRYDDAILKRLLELVCSA